jgi:hypothetical protein
MLLRREPMAEVEFGKGFSVFHYLSKCCNEKQMKKTKLFKHCQVCGVERETFQVPAFGPKLKDIHFCTKCGEFVSKKACLEKDALCLPASISFKDGTTERNHRLWYCEKEPGEIFHCNDVNMVLYYTKQLNPCSTLYVYECPHCKQEKYLEVLLRGCKQHLYGKKK